MPVTVRFANASGNPDVPDGAPGVRSLSVKFPLADGKTADVLANSVESFPASTPAVPKFLGSHPSAAAFIGRLMQQPVPASDAQSSYHAEHAFLFTAADGSRRYGRYHLVPDAGEAFLTPEEGAKRSANFLREELESRPRVELGRLEITRISPTGAEDEKRLIFDPTNRTDGIELSNDPILLARSEAYSISYERRSRGQ